MEKQQWQKPKLVTHGTLSELTKNKRWGFSDQWVVIKNSGGSYGGGSYGTGS